MRGLLLSLSKLAFISFSLITMLGACMDSGIYVEDLRLQNTNVQDTDDTTDPNDIPDSSVEEPPELSDTSTEDFTGKTLSVSFSDLPNSWSICTIDERYTDYSFKRSYTLSEDKNHITISVSDFENTECEGSPFDERHTVYTISQVTQVELPSGMASEIEIMPHYNERTMRENGEQMVSSLMLATPEDSDLLLVSEIHKSSQERSFQNTLFFPETASAAYKLHGNASEELLAETWADDICFKTHDHPALTGSESNPISANFNSGHGFSQDAPYSQYTISYRDNYYIRQSLSYDTPDCSGKPSYAEVTFGKYEQYAPLSMTAGTITPLNIRSISTNESLFNASMFFNKNTPLFLRKMSAYDEEEQRHTDTYYPDPSTFNYAAQPFRNEDRNLYVPLTIDKLENTRWQQSHCVNSQVSSPDATDKHIFTASDLYFNPDASEIMLVTRYYENEDGFPSNMAYCYFNKNAVAEFARVDKASAEPISYAGIDFMRFETELYMTQSQDPSSGFTTHPIDPPVKRYLYMAVSDGDYGTDISLVMFTNYGVEPSWKDIKTVGFFKL